MATSGETGERVGFVQVLRALLKGAPFAAFAVLAAVITSVLVTRSMNPVYETSATLLAARPPAGLSAFDIITPSAVDPRVYQRVLQDGPVVRDALFSLDGKVRGEQDIARFRQGLEIGIENHDLSSVIRISVRSSDPIMAAEQANAIAVRLIEWDRDRARLMFDNSIAALERAVEQADAEIARIVETGGPTSQSHQALAAALRDQRVRELEAARTRGASAVMVGLLEVLNRAEVPAEPIGPRLVFNTFVSMVLAVLLAYGIQIAAWTVRNEVGTRERLAQLTGTQVLAALVRKRRRSAVLAGDAVSYLRAGILNEASRAPRDSCVLGLTTPSAYYEKSGISVALAESMAWAGLRCVVLDADLRQRGTGLGLTLPGRTAVGLETYLRKLGGTSEVRAVTVEVEQGVGFDVLPTLYPTRQASELLSFGLGRLLVSLRQQYDVILLDLPPVLAYADALVAAPLCDGVILCVGDRCKSSAAEESARMLVASGGHLVGAVLTHLGGSDSRSSQQARPRSREPGSGPGEKAREREAGTAPSSVAVAHVRQRG